MMNYDEDFEDFDDDDEDFDDDEDDDDDDNDDDDDCAIANLRFVSIHFEVSVFPFHQRGLWLIARA